jgi:alkylation response protein AidB-like acyl-CoA dehydrogenase
LGEPQARFDLHDIRTTAERNGDGFVLRGAKSVVLHGDSADWLIVAARTSGEQRSTEGITVFVVDAGASGVRREGFPTIDHQRAAEVLLDAVRVDADNVIGHADQGYPVLEWGVDLALAALAAEAVGVMDRLTELTCEYLRNRVQFGKPIGSFQTLQHRAADMRIAVEQARALALMAAASVDSGDRALRRRGASAAKAMAGRSGRYVGQQATQLHGGMGMTDEMACGHYFKRLTAIDMTLGNTEHHVEMYGEFLDSLA